VRYRFLTTWLLETSPEHAWEAIEDVCQWPTWWRGVERVEVLDPGDGDGVGSRNRVTWRSRVPYSLTFDFTPTRVVRPHLMRGTAAGDLQGTGCWRLFEDNGVTAVVYDWNVATTKLWMNAIGPLAHPVFSWNHDVVMRWGGEGVAKRLGVRLLAAG
jgi:uncharacterized protein YndB with AHSA1/START domain